MRRRLGLLLVLAGGIVVVMAIMQYIEHQQGVKQAMAEANALLQQSHAAVQAQTGNEQHLQEDEVTEELPPPDPLIGRAMFQPQSNDVIGTLEIPKLEAVLPILEGTDDKMLKRGVGHYETSAFPLDDEQILLSGHRDTVFRHFDQLELGDRFLVTLPYGTFEYEIQSTDIVDADDTTVIRSMGEEVLVVTTCYPFRYVGDAPERFILYAYPVKDTAASEDLNV